MDDILLHTPCLIACTGRIGLGILVEELDGQEALKNHLRDSSYSMMHQDNVKISKDILCNQYLSSS